MFINFFSKNENCEYGNQLNVFWDHFDPGVIITELNHEGLTWFQLKLRLKGLIKHHPKIMIRCVNYDRL